MLQAPQIGCDGQAWQIAQTLGSATGWKKDRTVRIELATSDLGMAGALNILGANVLRARPGRSAFLLASQLPPTIDPVAAARWEVTAPASSPWLHEEVANRMQQRLDWIRLPISRWVHWGPVNGGLQAHRSLLQRYPKAESFAVETDSRRASFAAGEIAAPWWSPKRWQAPATQFAMPGAGSASMVWANMVLHGAADPQSMIARWHTLLAPGGFLMFSCLGPDTAHELHGLYRSLGWGEAGHAFTDMHDWGDMLIEAGFAEPVMDMERLVLTWSTPQRLLAELRELGRNLHPGRFAGLRTRDWREQLERRLEEGLADPAQEGRLALTVEVIYGHALKPEPRPASAALGGPRTVALSDMRAMLGLGRAKSKE